MAATHHWASGSKTDAMQQMQVNMILLKHLLSNSWLVSLLSVQPLCPAGLPEESSRVSVYWPADDEWYQGEVKDVDDCRRSHVKYDDGQVEILYFAVERYKLAEPTRNTGALKSSSLLYICNFACCVAVLLPVNAICGEA